MLLHSKSYYIVLCLPYQRWYWGQKEIYGLNDCKTSLTFGTCSGYRWIDYHDMSIDKEKEYIKKAITSLKSMSGYCPRGWYYGRNSPHSRTLVPQVYEAS
jgi:hypothetical protein